MQTITIEIYWSEHNYCCGWSYPEFGAILCTGATIDAVKSEFETSLTEQITSMVEDGEEVPQWLADGEYTIEYTLAVSALLRYAEGFTTMAALSRVTGINQKQLNNYASAVRLPRPEQRIKIIDGLRVISRQLLAFL